MARDGGSASRELRALSRSLLLLAGLFLPTPGVAADAVLVPQASASEGLSPTVASNIEGLVGEVMRDNEFVVLTPDVVRRAIGPVLDTCTLEDMASCATVALSSTPARLAILLRVSLLDGRTMLHVDFIGPGGSEPIRQMVLPVESGRERRVALQVTMFALDVAGELGPAPPALVDAARHLAMGGSSRPLVTEPVPDVDDLLAADDPEDLPPPPPPDEDLDDDPVDFDEPEPIERRRVVTRADEDDLGETTGSRDRRKGIPPRLYAGSEKSYNARRGDGDAWLKQKRPHAGRFILEFRGGVGVGDLARVSTILGTPGVEAGTLTGTFFQEAPLYAVQGRAEIVAGYAPATMVDISVLVGVNFSQDNVTVGYMESGQNPDLGDSEDLTVVRPYVQPRIRIYPVPLGVAKPYLVVGADLVFLSDWDYEVTTGEPFPRPRGGLIPGFVAGGGLVFDPHPRVGILIEGTGSRYFGRLSGPRFEGTLVGGIPEPLPGVRRWAVGITGGLQLRL